MSFFKGVLVSFFFLSLSVYGGVNLKNGNFYISYTDIVVPGGGEPLKITRTYNSKATEVGWFGFGWGSDYETFLKTYPDGSVVVHENGSGAQTRFTPNKKVDSSKAANKIVEAIRKKQSLTPQAVARLKTRLQESSELRKAYTRKYGIKTEISKGTELFSNERGRQKIKKTSSGYTRSFADGKKEYFNKDGQLVKIKEANGYEVVLEYRKGSLYSIKDNRAKQLYFEFYPESKLVKHIWSTKDKKTFYKYKGKNLAESKDIAGNVYKYDYDPNHNLTAVVYRDGKKMKVEYESTTQFVKSVTSKDGEKVSYKYESNPKNSELHYWTLVDKKNFAGKKITNRYEYEIKARPDGSQYTYRILTQINGIKTETIYSECCSLPLQITRGKVVTKFTYDDGLLTSKTSTTGEFVKLKYHKKFKKITRVQNNRGTTNYKYNKRGNLAQAYTSDGRYVKLSYDRFGRIIQMIDKKDKKRRTLTFKYNSQGKPYEIAMAKVGKINVKYDNYGEIKKVDSQKGHKMALQVTQAFQSLIALVKPAGVNLSL